MLMGQATGVPLALQFMPATTGPTGKLLEVYLIGGQAVFEPVHRLLVTLAGP